MEIKLTILGEPKSQKRHRSFMMKGRGIRQYDPSAADKKDFLSIIQNNAPNKPFDCPIKVSLDFYFTRPLSHFRSGKNKNLMKDGAPVYHTGRPDADNLIKFCMDAMNKIYWRDDSIICNLEIIKRYSPSPRTEITITIL